MQSDDILRPIPWEQLDREHFPIVGGADDEGIIRLIRVDPEGRVVWAPEVDRLRDDLQAQKKLTDEARDVARHILKKEDDWAYLAELVDAYPWLKG